MWSLILIQKEKHNGHSFSKNHGSANGSLKEYCLYNVITPCPGLLQTDFHWNLPLDPQKGLAVETERVPRVETENVNLWTQDIFVFVCDKFVSWIRCENT